MIVCNFLQKSGNFIAQMKIEKNQTNQDYIIVL
jgi:hypothetical protein